TLFIVDEASMIADNASESKLFENGSLLDDLMQYVYSGNHCKLILVGDSAQLPPVKMDLSPALESDTLQNKFNKVVVSIELDEVVRQKEKSGILENATRLREAIDSGFYEDFKFTISGYKDIINPADGNDLLDAINDAYQTLGKEE